MNDLIRFFSRVWGRICRIKPIHEQRKKYRAYFQQNPNCIFLVMTPNHGNLGDHAIAKAEIELLKKAGINCIEVTYWDLNDMRWAGMLEAMDGLPILVHGGGFLGTLWYDAEELLRKLIQKTPHSTIFLMPNTIFYEDTVWGREEFEKSKKLYNRRKKLHLYARERASYAIMKKAYRDVYLMPDMVFSLNECREGPERHGCLLCLRGDREKTRTEEQEKMIRQQAEILFGNAVSDTDTVLDHTISLEQREAELQAKFTQFSGAELVITDRLHGMIFCAITGTPCIVVDSKSPKVRGCYEWIKNLDYIRFANDVDCIAKEYRKIPPGKHTYDNLHLRHYFDDLTEVLKQHTHN